jgi:hypothetical protein
LLRIAERRLDGSRDLIRQGGALGLHRVLAPHRLALEAQGERQDEVRDHADVVVDGHLRGADGLRGPRRELVGACERLVEDLAVLHEEVDQAHLEELLAADTLAGHQEPLGSVDAHQQRPDHLPAVTGAADP